MARSLSFAVFGILSSLILLQPCLSAATTGAVEGVIKDKVTGQVLEGVKVTIISTKSETMTFRLWTDKKGHFYKGGLIPGLYKIAVEKEGYIPQEGTIRIIIEETVKFDIPLVPFQSAVPAADATSQMLSSGSELMASGKYQEAIAKFSEVIGQAPTNPTAYFYRAAAYEKTGNSSGALEDYKKAAELRPDFILCYARSGIILAKNGEFEKAAEFYRRAIDLGEKDPSTHYNYGVCLVNLGRNEEARGAFENVLILDPNYADACYQLGLIFIGAGDSAKAKELLEKFLAVNPENKNAGLAKEILKNLN